MRSSLDSKVLLVLILFAILIGWSLAKIMYPVSTSPIKTSGHQSSRTENSPYIFPEQPQVNPFKKNVPEAITPEHKPKPVCTNDTVSAVDPSTLKIQQFSGSCSVPKNWKILN